MQPAWHMQTLRQTASTNDVARAAVLASWARGEPAGALAFQAARQSAGRGQHGRTWESPPGGLYLSAVLEDVPDHLRPHMALLAGAAIIRALENVPDLGWRWPNDIMLQRRKLGGVLCESLAEGRRWATIVGIGLNVATDLAELPATLRPHAASLREVGTYTPESLTPRLLETLATEIATARSAGLGPALALVRPIDVLLHTPVHVTTAGKTIRGRAAGLTDTGALRIETPDGMVAVQTGTLRQDAGPTDLAMWLAAQMRLVGPMPPELVYKVTAPRELMRFEPSVFYRTEDFQSSSNRLKPGYIQDTLLYAGDAEEISIHLLPKIDRLRVVLTEQHRRQLATLGWTVPPEARIAMFVHAADVPGLRGFRPTVYCFDARHFARTPSNEFVARTAVDAIGMCELEMRDILERWRIQIIPITDIPGTDAQLRTSGIDCSWQN